MQSTHAPRIPSLVGEHRQPLPMLWPMPPPFLLRWPRGGLHGRWGSVLLMRRGGLTGLPSGCGGVPLMRRIGDAPWSGESGVAFVQRRRHRRRPAGSSGRNIEAVACGLESDGSKGGRFAINRIWRLSGRGYLQIRPTSCSVHGMLERWPLIKFA